ncbi:hypothetical protein V6N13_136916 [Hibiscus sabdariffa]
MYYASVVAYHIFFNSSRYLYFLLLLSFSLLCIFMFPTDMGNMKEWAAPALFSAATANNNGGNSFWETLLLSQISASPHCNQSQFKLSSFIN